MYCIASILSKVNVRENRKGHREWTIQRHRLHLEQDKQRQQKNTTQQTKKMNNMEHLWVNTGARKL